MIIPKGVTVKGKAIADRIYNQIEKGLSATKLLREIEHTKWGMRKKTFLADFRKFKVAIQGWDAVKSAPKNYRLNPEYFIKPEHTIVEQRYAYVYESTIIDTLTGEQRLYHETYGSDILETKEDIMRRIEDDWKAKYLRDTDLLTNTNIVQTYRGNKL